jgi:putative transposase
MAEGYGARKLARTGHNGADSRTDVQISRHNGSMFDHAVEGAGITLIHTPPYAPRANAMCERFMGSVRREFLDHILILSEGHARRLAKEYVQYFNYARPHQGIDGQLPVSFPAAFLLPPGDRSLRRISVLNGLHHDYRWAA